MRYFLIVFIVVGLCAAQEQIERSVLNSGGDWQAADAQLLEDVRLIVDGANAEGSFSFLYHYTYTVSDSAIMTVDMNQDYPVIIERWVEPTADECPVELTYATVTKASPAKWTHAVYDTWDGGPRPSGVKPLNAEHRAKVREYYTEYKLKVDALIDKDKDKDWKIKGKKLDKAEKRGAAWKLLTKRLTESDIEKVKK